jgi:hypothetical protein
MNEQYLFITGALLTYPIIQAYFGAFESHNALRFFSTLFSSVAAIFMLGASFLTELGDSRVDYFDATITRVGDEFIVQSECPTMNVTDIKYENKLVKVERTQYKNSWGMDLEFSTKYRIVIIK